MFTWKDYYVEFEQRLNQMQYRLVKALLDMKKSCLRNSPFRIQTAQFAYNKETSYEHK